MLLDRRIVPTPCGLQGVARLLASIRKQHNVESTDRQTSLNPIATVQDDPGFPAIVGDAQPEPRQALVEVVDLLRARRRLQGSQRSISKMHAPAYRFLCH